MAEIRISNIYYMLAYAFQWLNIAEYENISSEPFDNIQDLFGDLLSKGIALQLKRGLHREYIKKNDNLSVMRGKLNITDTIKNRVQNRVLLGCEYRELSENIICNQVIKTVALMLIKSDEVKEDTKKSLKKEMLFFANIDTVSPNQIRWDMIRINKNNQSYRVLLSICRLVLEGLLLSTDKGEIKLARFLDEQKMCRLYEKFILEFYRKEVPDVKASAAEIKWQIDEGNVDMLPSMQSDIVLTRDNGKTLIIDAKYYHKSTQTQFDKTTIHSNNLYQIFTYVKNYDVGNTGNVEGLLLYAKTDEEITPDMDVIISGNKIGAKTLDLNQDFSEISKQLKDIAANL